MDYNKELEILRKQLLDVNTQLMTGKNNSKEKESKLLELKGEIIQNMANLMMAKQINDDFLKGRGIEYDKYKRR